ncbi:MAG: hypothetical protein ACXWEA_06990, partial [Solirubrobacterales bacterium]
ELFGSAPVDVRFDWIFSESGLDNDLTVFKVDDTAGSIGSLEPGDNGYLEAAEARKQVIFPAGSNAFTPDVTVTFQGGDILAFSIANTFYRFYSVDALNFDGLEHMLGFRHLQDGSVQFGFEDAPPEVGRDFNDVVFNAYAPLAPLPPLAVTKTADLPTTGANATNGYTIKVTNSGDGAAILDSISDDLPAGFSYSNGSTSGVTNANPTISGGTLTWDGPFTVPPGGDVSLHFGVRVASTPGSYLNEATAEGEGFPIAPTGKTAQVTVTGSNQPPVTGSPNQPPTASGQSQDAVCRGKVATIVGSTGPDRIAGSQLPDVIATLGGKDRVSAAAGKDVVCGGTGKDVIKGGKGNDTLFGEAGKDRLVGGGSKTDRCVGGPGRDRGASCEKGKI